MTNLLLFDTVKKNLEKWSSELAPTLAVGVSGGIDSMVLLHVLRELQADFGYKLRVVHVNHQLRENANDDEEFVRSTCKMWSVSCDVVRLNWKSRGNRQRQVGVEAAARELRYEAFQGSILKVEPATLVLAHHATDQVETFLLRYLRGASLSGLGAMQFLSQQDQLKVFRPLLSVSQREIECYQEENEIPFVHDETNDVETFSRNYLRHRVVPELRHLQPNLEAVTSRLTRYVREDDEYLLEAAARTLSTCVERTASGIRCSLTSLNGLPRPILRRCFTLLLRDLGSLPSTSKQIEDLIGFCQDADGTRLLPIGSGWTALREYNTLLFIKSEEDAGVPDTLQTGLPFQQELQFGESWVFACDVWSPENGYHTGSSYELYVSDAVRNLVIRTMEPGMRISPLGLSGRKKVQDVFTDAKIPRRQRTVWPLVFAGDSLIWIPGLVRSREYLLTSTDQMGYKVRAFPSFS